MKLTKRQYEVLQKLKDGWTFYGCRYPRTPKRTLYALQWKGLAKFSSLIGWRITPSGISILRDRSKEGDD